MRVIELSDGPAAGFAGMLLAQLGHEVIRVELPWRGPQPPTAVLNETERAYLHRGKQTVSFGDDPAYRGPLFELAITADALVEDLGRGGIGRYGLTVHALRKAKRDLVVASISPYGHSGPKSRWAASELTIQASAGVLHSTGWVGETPFKAGGFPAHYIAGIHAATAVLARVFGVHAGASRGGRIEVSMQEAYLHHWTRHIGEWAYTGTKMRREKQGFGHQGFRHTAMAADGWLYILALYADWESIALFLGLEDFVTGEWGDPAYRANHWQDLEETFARNVAARSRYDWFADAAAAGYTFAPVHAAEDQLTNPQFAARGFLRESEVQGRVVPCPGLPFPWDSPAPAPPTITTEDPNG